MEIKKIFLHKYVLSTGEIEEIEVKFVGPTLCKRIDDRHFGLYNHNDYSFTKEEAVIKANERIDKKIKSLQKQIEKLSKIHFH